MKSKLDCKMHFGEFIVRAKSKK